jgi:hypothetical protein
MSLQYILKRVASIAGMSTDNADQKAFMLDIINEAAQEIYSHKDLPVVLKEVYCKLTNGTKIALPPFVGEIRAMRSQRWNDKWSLLDMRPRYSAVDWTTKFDKVRIIGEAAIVNEITNASVLTVTVETADPELIITVVGETTTSNRSVDAITMDAVSKLGVKSFTDIRSIKKNKVTDDNVIITDADGNEIALIYADQLESRYMIVDVSDYPTLIDCAGQGIFVMEVLYKPRLPRMELDADEFPVMGYDDDIVLKSKAILTEDQEG